jgi:small subunit ribosomal protein S16
VLKIRLQRLGRKKRPNYRVVLAEHSAPVQGRYVTSFGFYDPLAKQEALKVDTEAILEWIKKGAQPTNTIARLLKGEGVKGVDQFIVEMKDKKVKNPSEEEAVPAAEASAEIPAEPAPEAAEPEKSPEEAPAESAPEEVEEKAAEEPAPEDEKKSEEVPAEEEKPAEEAPAEPTPETEEEKPAQEEAPVEDKSEEGVEAEKK